MIKKIIGFILLIALSIVTACNGENKDENIQSNKGNIKKIKLNERSRTKLTPKKNEINKKESIINDTKDVSKDKTNKKIKSKYERKIIGSWIMVKSKNKENLEGFVVKEDGGLESINSNKGYKNWKIDNNKLFLTIEAKEVGSSSIFRESYDIESLSNTTLRLRKGTSIIKYKKQDKLEKEIAKELKNKENIQQEEKNNKEKEIIKKAEAQKRNYSRKEAERVKEEKRRLIREAIRKKNPNNRNNRANQDPKKDRLIENAFRDKLSNIQVENSGVVVHILPDDLDGIKHQKFIIKLASGKTVLIAHNIDLAPKIKNLKKGDRVYFNGEYEWSDRGGVVHWTHKDPRKKHISGWLKHNSKTYQ